MFEGKKIVFWLPLNKHAMNIWLSSLRIRAHLNWRTGKHLHVLHVLRTYSTCSYPGYQDTTTYAALPLIHKLAHAVLTLPSLTFKKNLHRVELVGILCFWDTSNFQDRVSKPDYRWQVLHIHHSWTSLPCAWETWETSLSTLRHRNSPHFSSHRYCITVAWRWSIYISFQSY